MGLNKESIIEAIKAEIVRIAAVLDGDASDLQPDELIPASGYIDSAGLLDLIAWFEKRFEVRVAPDEFNVDNLGTMNAMADFAQKHKARR
jgi:D-alanine--poly(phosphoribitol) ligase subunit 2